MHTFIATVLYLSSKKLDAIIQTLLTVLTTDCKNFFYNNNIKLNYGCLCFRRKNNFMIKSAWEETDILEDGLQIEKSVRTGGWEDNQIQRAVGQKKILVF